MNDPNPCCSIILHSYLSNVLQFFIGPTIIHCFGCRDPLRFTLLARTILPSHLLADVMSVKAAVIKTMWITSKPIEQFRKSLFLSSRNCCSFPTFFDMRQCGIRWKTVRPRSWKGRVFPSLFRCPRPSPPYHMASLPLGPHHPPPLPPQEHDTLNPVAAPRRPGMDEDKVATSSPSSNSFRCLSCFRCFPCQKVASSRRFELFLCDFGAFFLVVFSSPGGKICSWCERLPALRDHTAFV